MLNNLLIRLLTMSWSIASLFTWQRISTPNVISIFAGNFYMRCSYNHWNESQNDIIIILNHNLIALSAIIWFARLLWKPFYILEWPTTVMKSMHKEPNIGWSARAHGNRAAFPWFVPFISRHLICWYIYV